MDNHTKQRKRLWNGCLKMAAKKKPWNTTDGRRYFPLPDCMICRKRSSTTDKDTARDAQAYGQICRACKQGIKLIERPVVISRKIFISIQEKGNKLEQLKGSWLNRLVFLFNGRGK